MKLTLCSRRLGCLGLVSLAIATLQTAHAGSATWNLNPANSDWRTASNWTPATVPNGASDVATFNQSNITTITDGKIDALSAIVFNPGASAYSITLGKVIDVFQYTEIGGAGITNNSGILQQFTVPAGVGEGTKGRLHFINSATAGTLTQFTINGSDDPDFEGGQLEFHDTASAGSATFIIPPPSGGGDFGLIFFNDASTAGDATFINHGWITFVTGGGGNGTFQNEAGTLPGYSGTAVYFLNGATAGSGTYINEGAAVAGANPARTEFDDYSSAANATLIANGGPFGGGLIVFGLQSPGGGKARVELFGNGTLDVSQQHQGTTIGSLEGNGLAFVGAKTLTIGSNNLNTTFSVVIQDGGISGGTGGSVTKIGKGNLTLTNANSYTGGTTVNDGILLANNTTGSATGRSPVKANAGLLGGSGTIAGAVTIGTGGGSGAILGPGKDGSTPGTLTIRKKLTLMADATYKVLLNSDIPAADKVNAKGVRIRGALILFDDRGTSVLSPGTVLTAINNTAALPISGTFSNLADGSTVTIGPNTFQADYQGGDGNDLTLTVVP